MSYTNPFKIAKGLVLDFTLDGANTASDSFLGLNTDGEVTAFASIPSTRISGGNFTEATSSVLTITGGAGAVLGSGLTIQVKLAGAAQSGYLSTADWNTFNGKLSPTLQDGYILVGNSSDNATEVLISGDITLSNSGVASISSGVIINADINASAAIAYSKMETLSSSLIMATSVSGEATTISGFTTTIAGYLTTLSGNVQTQLNNRLQVTLSSPSNGDVITYNGTQWVNSPAGTGVPSAGLTNQILRKIDATNYNTEWHSLEVSDLTDISSTASEINILSGVTASSTQLNYLNTTTSNIQSQLDLKLSNSLAYNALFIGNISNVAIALATGSNGTVLTSVGGVPTWQAPGTGGTVTSVDVSGGSTGIAFTGGPINTSGTITMSGTLNISSGGTNSTTALSNNRVMRSSGGAIVEATAITPGKILKSDSNGIPVATSIEENPRVQTVTSSATVTANADSNDCVDITAQATGLTLANPTGTPSNFDMIVYRIKDNGTARSVSFDTDFRAIGVTLPATTVLSKTLYIVTSWNQNDTKWDVVGVIQE